jgi:hypothetical protein
MSLYKRAQEVLGSRQEKKLAVIQVSFIFVGVHGLALFKKFGGLSLVVDQKVLSCHNHQKRGAGG